jgi:tRNA(Phe) wybutosine-synthesizing methylase Tyw3
LAKQTKEVLIQWHRLYANGVPDALDDLRYPDGKKILINEANLVFHIDATTMAATKEIEYVCTTYTVYF